MQNPSYVPVANVSSRTEQAQPAQHLLRGFLHAVRTAAQQSTLFSIHSADPEAVTRGRLLKFTALIVALAVLVNVPVAISNPSLPLWLPWGLVGMALISLVVFGMAHVGYIMPGGMVLSSMLILIISISSPPESLLTRPIAAAYGIPMVIAGMVIGAWSVPIVGLMTLLAFILITAVSGEPWSAWTLTALTILVVSGGQLWLLVRTLERFRDDGHAQAAAARAAEAAIAVREAQMAHQAFHDPLTKLPNRSLFMERLRQAVERAKWQPDYQFAVLFLDLDRFKVINDSLGHSNGDRLLIAFAQRIQQCLRTGDMLARLGGDEFTILLDSIAYVQDPVKIANRIQEQLVQPFALDNAEVFTSTSIGIAIGTTDSSDADALLRDADTAMYRAKAMGKARHAIFDTTMHTHAVERLQLEMDLRRAMEHQELRLHYQPIISLKTGWITGFEALVRYHHPQRGLIGPSDFISLAEETGLIIPLGQWVLREACHQMRNWQQHVPPRAPYTVSVNFSGKQFAAPGLVEQIADLLEETGLDAHRLRLEITESVIMENAQSVALTLAQLRALDVQLQIDDFGTGYSSLSALHRFPIDALKIDRSFVSTLGTNPESAAIIQAIVTLGHTLGLDVIAEGIETEAQLTQLRAFGCDYGQGFLFAPPLEPSEAQQLLVAQHSGRLRCQWESLSPASMLIAS